MNINNIFFFKENSKPKKSCEKSSIVYVFLQSSLNVWLNSRQLDPHIYFCIQPAAPCWFA